MLTDYRSILRLAWPVVLSNAMDTFMMMVDRLFLSRLENAAGSEVVLGGAIGGAVIAWLVEAPLLGMLLYTNAMASQSFGRGERERCAQVCVQAMYWVLLYYPLLLALSGLVPGLLLGVGHAPALAEQEWNYARVLIIGTIFPLLRLPLNSFFIASNRSGLVMKVSFIGLALNIPLDYWFIFDLSFLGLRPTDLGLNPGIAGAAAATVAAQILTWLLLFLIFLRQSRVWRIARAWRWRGKIHRELLRFGLPASVEGFLTSLLFNMFLMLFNSISPLVAAAATITFSWDLCNFIVLLGIGTATTTLVGQSLGAGDIARARRYTRLILSGALAFSGFVSLWFIFAPDLLSRAFVTNAAAQQQELLCLSRQMLRLATFYLLSDALGVVMRGALNSAGDTVAVMLISMSMQLLLIAGVIVMLKVWKLGAIEIWAFFVAYVLLVNLAFAWRYATGRWTRRWEQRP